MRKRQKSKIFCLTGSMLAAKSLQLPRTPVPRKASTLRETKPELKTIKIAPTMIQRETIWLKRLRKRKFPRNLLKVFLQ